MRRFARVLLLLCLLVSVPAQARPLKITTIDSAPFGYFDGNGQSTGIMYEIGNRIAEEAGLTYTNTIVPYARTVVELEHGDCDFVLRYSNEKLEQVAIPVATIISLPTIIVTPAGTRLRSLSDLHGKTVGVMRGGRFDDAFDADSAILKVETNNYEQTLRMMLAGRFAASIGSNVGLYFNARRAGIRPEQLAPPLVLGEKSFYLHFSRKTADEETVAAVKAAVARLKARGEIRKIVQRYLGDFPLDVAGTGKY